MVNAVTRGTCKIFGKPTIATRVPAIRAGIWFPALKTPLLAIVDLSVPST